MPVRCCGLNANKVFLVAPATGTPETGGWSTRELRTIIRGLEGINLIATDIVEVAPAYDTNAELTTMAAAVSSIAIGLTIHLMRLRMSCMR
jgi:agmatinase